MSYAWWFVVIFITSGVLLLGAGCVLGRWDRPSPARLAPVAPGPRDVTLLPSGPVYGPFPVDTGPLLLWSEGQAARDELGRWTGRAISETDWLIEAGEREIPARWR